MTLVRVDCVRLYLTVSFQVPSCLLFVELKVTYYMQDKLSRKGMG